MKLSHQEITDSLSTSLRELMAVEVSHRNIPNLINRGKAVAAIVTAHHREEIMEAKRQSGIMTMTVAQGNQVKGLKRKC